MTSSTYLGVQSGCLWAMQISQYVTHSNKLATNDFPSFTAAFLWEQVTYMWVTCDLLDKTGKRYCFGEIKLLLSSLRKNSLSAFIWHQNQDDTLGIFRDITFRFQSHLVVFQKNNCEKMAIEVMIFYQHQCRKFYKNTIFNEYITKCLKKTKQTNKKHTCRYK